MAQRTITIAIAAGLAVLSRPPVTPGLIAGAAQQNGGLPAAITMPMKEGSLKFAVIGDFGDGTQREYDTAAQFVKAHAAFPFTVVPLTGDNLYGSERPQDFQKKFETP